MSSDGAFAGEQISRSGFIPFLEVVPLRTAKAADLEKFCRVLELMRASRHLELDGIAEIASIVERMNQRKKSSFLRILRDCTPAASEQSEAKIQSVLHGDMERLAEMSSPLRVTARSRNQVRA